MDSFIIPAKKEINKIELCHCFQFVCKGDRCKVREINQTWFFFSFSHLLTEFKITLNFLSIYRIVSLSSEETKRMDFYCFSFPFILLFNVNGRNE